MSGLGGIDTGIGGGGGGGITTPATFNAGNSGTTKTIDWSNGPDQILTLTGNCTLTFTGTPQLNRASLITIQDGTGGRTLTWPASVKGPNGTKPQPTSAAGSRDRIVLAYDTINSVYDAAVGVPASA